MRVWYALFASCLALPAWAGFDPAGKSIDWTGQIVAQTRHDEDTCFKLRRSRQETDRTMPEVFEVCAFGYYSGSDYETGDWLRARGILQPESFDNLPWVAAARVTPATPPYDPRFDNPAYGPWPGWGSPMFGPWEYPFAPPWGMYPYPYPYFW
ncbi:MAG: hypothetical protein M0T86_02855 [Betaproteobacteria bacterium]|nr:hypothetical protein [Betaproteobacteria bacterium]